VNTSPKILAFKKTQEITPGNAFQIEIEEIKKIEEGTDGYTGKRLFGMFRGLEKTLHKCILFVHI